ncbi:MAG: toxin-antitoxin system YwqK family antitoxin [Bacteroidota bacterium]
MKPTPLSTLETIHLDGWELIKESPSANIYRTCLPSREEEDIQKHLSIFENYSLEQHYKNNQLHGLSIGRMNQAFFHFPDYQSKIYLIERYHQGKLEGTSEHYYKDGTRVHQKWKSDQLHGKTMAWFPNGQKEKEQHFTNGKKDGQQFQWYDNGQLKLAENFKAGKPSGESHKYLANGLLKRKKAYKNGKIQGIVYELWDYNGQPVEGGIYSETEYKNDLPHGKEIVYFSDHTKMREGSHVNGLVEGEKIWWNQNGTISIKEYYKNGELEGQRLLYDENGDLENVQHYENGARIS